MQEIIDTSDASRYPVRSTVVFDTPFSTIADAPIVIMAAAFLPTGVDLSAFEKAFAAAVYTSGRPDGFIAGTRGWAKEEVDNHPKMQGTKAKVFVTASGWESIEK